MADLAQLKFVKIHFGQLQAWQIATTVLGEMERQADLRKADEALQINRDTSYTRTCWTQHFLVRCPTRIDRREKCEARPHGSISDRFHTCRSFLEAGR